MRPLRIVGAKNITQASASGQTFEIFQIENFTFKIALPLR